MARALRYGKFAVDLFFNNLPCDESGVSIRADVPMFKVKDVYARGDDLVSIATCSTQSDSAEPRWAEQGALDAPRVTGLRGLDPQ